MPFVLAGIGIMAIAWRWARLRGTTLIAPAIWSILALLVLAISDTIGSTVIYQGTIPSWVSVLRYFSGVTTFCPAMALLGAKRPQNGAWQFIVLTLWIVLCLPALHWWLVGGGQVLEIHTAESWFLAILVLMVAANHLPTRFAVASLMFTVAQLCLLVDSLPGSCLLPLSGSLSLRGSFVALLLCVTAIVVVCCGWPKRWQTPTPLDRVWLDFRDTFGAVWGLRVAQRINQSATMYDWKVRLDWHGFTPLETTAMPPETEKAVCDSFQNLLRRFVSPVWIAERLKQPVD